jgi:hypothetical protein
MNTDQLKTWSEISGEPATYYVHASEEEREEMRQWVKGLLRERQATIEFTKATGETRVMNCTLSESVIPAQVNKSTERRPNPDICVVWDTGKGEWRSFRWDRMKRIEFTIG